MSENANQEVFQGYVVRRERWTIAGEVFEFCWPADIDVLLDEPRTHALHQADGYMPYWAQPWPGTVLLAEAIVRGEPGADRPAIEIGCGVGIAGVVAAKRGWSVTVSDYDENALAYAQRNAELNGVRLAGAALIDFRRPPAVPLYDLILGSDLLYERRHCEPVARWIAAALNPGGLAILSDPFRTAAESFPDHARGFSLTPRMERVESNAPTGMPNRGRIWYVTRG